MTKEQYFKKVSEARAGRTPGNKSKIIVFDTETTGLTPGEDEILQISIISGSGRKMLNTYIKPYFKKEWAAAQAVNGISPEMVENAPYLHEAAPAILACFMSAETAIAYNAQYDVKMLKAAGVRLPEVKIYDVMEPFAEIYGDWNEYFQSYKWQKLTTAAAYYGYKFKAHDALEDVKATLHVYKCMMEGKEKA